MLGCMFSWIWYEDPARTCSLSQHCSVFFIVGWPNTSNFLIIFHWTSLLWMKILNDRQNKLNLLNKVIDTLNNTNIYITFTRCWHNLKTEQNVWSQWLTSRSAILFSVLFCSLVYQKVNEFCWLPFSGKRSSREK